MAIQDVLTRPLREFHQEALNCASVCRDLSDKVSDLERTARSTPANLGARNVYASRAHQAVQSCLAAAKACWELQRFYFPDDKVINQLYGSCVCSYEKSRASQKNMDALRDDIQLNPQNGFGRASSKLPMPMVAT